MNAPQQMLHHEDYEWWHNALSGVRGDIHDGEPMSGYYRSRRKGEQAKAVAYWRDSHDGSLRCKVDDRDVDEMRAKEMWPFASREPVSYESYKIKRETGRWPDMDDAIEPSRSGIGGNNPPEETEAEAIRRQIDAASIGASDYATIKDLETKAKAQSLRSRLLELAGQAKKVHKTKKEPLWERIKEIDNTYLPLAKDAEAVAKQIREAMDTFDSEELKKVRAAERAAQEARDKIIREAALAEKAGKPAPEIPPAPPPAPYVPQQTRGAYGRTASNKIVKVVTEITDWTVLCEFLKTHPEFKEMALNLAQRAVAKGFDVPGVKTEEKVRNV